MVWSTDAVIYLLFLKRFEANGTGFFLEIEIKVYTIFTFDKKESTKQNYLYFVLLWPEIRHCKEREHKTIKTNGCFFRKRK